MPLFNVDVAAVFSEMADLLEVEYANPLRVRAHRKAAQLLSNLKSAAGLHQAVVAGSLRAIAAASFGAAWLYFTGSKAHNVALRKLALGAGLKLNEHGKRPAIPGDHGTFEG